MAYKFKTSKKPQTSKVSKYEGPRDTFGNPVSLKNPSQETTTTDIEITTLPIIEPTSQIEYSVEKLPYNINLNKELYGKRTALEELDEEFTEFILTKYTTKDYFNLLNKFFYNIDRETLSKFMGTSGNYIGGYKNPLDVEISTLKQEVNSIKDQIDSVEKEHPYLKNGKVIADSIYKNNASAAVQQGNIFYIQCRKRRPIQNIEVYKGIKNRLSKNINTNSNQTSDQDFIIFIDQIFSLQEGPPIFTFDDIYTPPADAGTNNITLYLNRYGSSQLGVIDQNLNELDTNSRV